MTAVHFITTHEEGKQMTAKERLAKIRFFTVRPDLSSLAENERKALESCVRAARTMTDIYLEQVAHGNADLYRALQERGDTEGIDLLRYFNVHGSPWDSYDHDRPFVPGIGPRPKFGSFYPVGFTKEEWDMWLNQYPNDRESFENPCTVIERSWGGYLAAVPYAKEYEASLTEAARQLRSAATHLPDGTLRSFLLSRADAFSSNNYFDSDMAWVDTDGNPFEVTIGPYEVYFDGLLGLKASFEAFIGIPDKDATAALGKFTPVVPEFDGILSQEFNFRPKGAAIPLEVVSDVIRGGEAAFGYGFVAYNLPNDRRIHELKGSKKVFSRTMMQAKFDTLAFPVAQRIFAPGNIDRCSFYNRFLFVLAHELAHGLGPSTVRDGDRNVPFETKLGDLHSCLEEAKADMLGARLLTHFHRHGLIDDETMIGIIFSEFAAYVQSWRNGFTEAHARGHLIQYNWLRSNRAVRYDSIRNIFEIDHEKTLDAMVRLSTEFLNLQIAGDYDQAKAFMEQWGTVPSELPPLIGRLADLPKSVQPIYEL